MTFDVILADPPWKFKVWSDETGRGKSADRHYPTMDLEAIADLPVRDLIGKNAALFLWVVDWLPLDYRDRLIRKWGFTYRTRGWVWIKSKRDGTGFHFGTGYYTRANPEDCLLCVRGSMPVADRGISRVLYAPVGRHSEKPVASYEIIERLYPGKKYLELFARTRRDGWSVWGNEVDSDITL